MSVPNMKKITLDAKDGVKITYGAMPMPPMRAMPMALRLSKIISTALKHADFDLSDLSGYDKSPAGKKKPASSTQESGAISVFMSAISGLDVDDVMALAKEAITYDLHAEDKKLTSEHRFNEHFSEYPEHMFMVCGWLIWENTKDFLPVKAVGQFASIMGQAEQ